MDLSQAAADVTLDSTPRVRPTNPTSNSTVTCEYHLSPLKCHRILVSSILFSRLAVEHDHKVASSYVICLEFYFCNVTQIAI